MTKAMKAVTTKIMKEQTMVKLFIIQSKDIKISNQNQILSNKM